MRQITKDWLEKEKGRYQHRSALGSGAGVVEVDHNFDDSSYYVIYDKKKNDGWHRYIHKNLKSQKEAIKWAIQYMKDNPNG